VWRDAFRSKCEACGTTFNLGLGGVIQPLDAQKQEMKLEVYREARAEYLRQQSGRSE
jgi:transposase-like protein